MSSSTFANRRLNNAGYPVQDRFAYNFGKTVANDGFLMKEIDLGFM